MLFLRSYDYLFSCVCGLCHHLQPDLILDNFSDLLVEAWSYFFSNDQCKASSREPR